MERLQNAVRVWEQFFEYPGTFPTTAVTTGLIGKTTAAAGSPTISVVSGGEAQLTLDNTSEVQNLCLYGGDVLPFDIEDLLFFEALYRLSGTPGTGVEFAMGLTSARNDAIDSIAEAALIRNIASLAIVAESDDGTNNNDDKATGINVGTTVATSTLVHIDFGSGVFSQDPPTGPVGARANVLFSVGNSRQNLRRVCTNTRFDMSNYAGNLQFFAQLQKTSSTEVLTASIRGVRVGYKIP
jgi:hypothetical protein